MKETKPDTETEAHDGRTRVRGGDVDVDLPDAEFVRAAAGRAAGDPALDDATRAYLAVT